MTFHYLKELVEKSGMDTPFTAVNNFGEDVIIERGEDFFCVTTVQSNDWLRINEYYKDGTITETYQR